MKMIVFVAALALAACSKDSGNAGQGSATTAAAGATCEQAGTNAVSALPATGPAAAIQAKLKEVITTRCNEDKWPAASIDCYANQVKDMAGMKKCRATLPQEQQQKLLNMIRGVMMGAMGGDGPMHPGGAAPH